MKPLLPHEIHSKQLLSLANTLPSEGKLEQIDSYYTYLNVSDDYIYQLLPILQTTYPHADIPNYFTPPAIGAHISVAYPNEKVIISASELKGQHGFCIKGLYHVRIAHKIYYVLLVSSPSLLALRKHYQLSEQLNFKGHAIDFHLTIATQAQLITS